MCESGMVNSLIGEKCNNAKTHTNLGTFEDTTSQPRLSKMKREKKMSEKVSNANNHTQTGAIGVK
jgi:hypothetical protein